MWFSFFILCQFLVFLCNGSDEFNADVLNRNFIGRNLECGGTARHKRLTMRSPSPLPRQCVYNIAPLNRWVCQLRIDFDMILQPPTQVNTAPSACISDAFTVNGIRLCGMNRNQHIYVPFNVTRLNLRDTLQLRFDIADRYATPGLGYVSWNLRVTQLECPAGSPRAAFERATDLEPLNPFTVRTIINDAFLIAPPGCLQYYPESSGVIESFNFNGGNGPYLSNFEYAICLRRRHTDKKLVLKPTTFKIDSVAAATAGYGANCMEEKADAVTSADYLVISNSVVGEVRTSLFCGDTAQGETITSTMSGPYVISFHSDNRFTASAHTKAGGFRIEYTIEGGQ